jgi:hypothetical protein
VGVPASASGDPPSGVESFAGLGVKEVQPPAAISAIVHTAKARGNHSIPRRYVQSSGPQPLAGLERRAADRENLAGEVPRPVGGDEDVVLDPDPAEGRERLDEVPVDELGLGLRLQLREE